MSKLSFVWILRHFSGNVAMLSLYLPLQILLNSIFPKEPSIWFVNLVTDLRIISPHLRHSEQVCSIVSSLLFSFTEKFAQGPRLLDSACGIPVVLIFDICNVYEIVAYDWLYSQYRGQVKMVDMVLKFLVNIEAVFVNLSWCAYIIFCLNSKTFSGDICFPFTCPFRSF